MSVDVSESEFDPFAGPEITAHVESTESQREIWTAARAGDGASLAFNEAVTISLRGSLDVDALDGALTDLVARHESLRSTFSDDGRVLYVNAPSPVSCPLLDWSADPPPDQNASLEAHERSLVQTPFDLVTGPLVRFHLVRLAPQHHVLTICAHHIVCDGWSYGVIATELPVAYNARLQHSNAALAVAETFRAYAEELQSTRGSAEAAEAETYWLARYRGDVPVLELPTDRARPPLRRSDAAREDLILSPTVVAQLKQLGARQGTTLFVSMLAGFATLLRRLTQQDEVVVGIPSAGQSASGRHTLVGHCVNLLPLRLPTPADRPFRDVLVDTRRTTFDALDHQRLGYGSLLALLPLERDPGRLPLASVAFNLDRGIGAEAMPFSGLQAALRSVPRTHENFELFLNVVELDGTLTCELQYSTALFDRVTIRRWLALYERLLLSATQDESVPVGRLAILPDEEIAQLTRWNETYAPIALDALGHHAFERAATAAPDAVALAFEGATMTYGALERRANQVAHALRARGVRRGVMVGLCVRRGPQMVVGMLAIFKAGGTYVPLDPDLPAERLSFTMDDAGLGLLLTESALTPQLVSVAALLLALDASAAIDEAPTDRLTPGDDDAGPETPAYVIYTSGSSGIPKGCLCTHRGLVNFVVTGSVVPALQAHDVCIALATLSFDASIIELILPLAAGARLIICSREVATDGVQLRQVLEREEVTFIFATPATYRLLLAAGWRGNERLTIGCGAEALPTELADALLARAGTVWNAYGPTEATVWGSAQRLPRPLTRVTIGRPLPNVRYHVLDALGQRVPVGVPGELYIGGLGVAAGYHQRPELTAQRFLPDPFSPDDAARMYRTGDVVRWLSDGEVEYLGRNDDQVKVRGYRIELGEIENRLASHPDVAGCAVMLREDRADDKRLVAYLATGAVSGPTDAELRTFLRATLPDYMVPQAFVRLPALPLTASGKINRKALPAPTEDDVSREAFVAPRSEAERLVAALWSAALRVGRLGVDDDFFQLGGHSLMASKVLADLRREHGVELPYRAIFEAPTLAQFAARVEGALAEGATAPSVAIPHRTAERVAPLSIAQQRLWMLEELNAAEHVVHSHGGAWRLRGRLDVAAVEGALDDFARRHPLMRTHFTTIDGAPAQVVEDEPALALCQVDLSATPPGDRERVLQEFFEEQERLPFDRARAPLMRATLVRFADDEHVLHTLRHALVWDGWSFDIFLSDFCALYSARVEQRQPALDALPITYGDFARWQREWIKSPEMERQIAWWRQHLQGDLPVLDLATDFPRPSQASHAGGRVFLSFSTAEVEELQRLARGAGATMFQLLFAAFNTLLYRHSGQCDLLVGTPVRARSRTETTQVVGPFVNTIAMRVRLTPEMPFTELLRQVRDVSLDAFGHQEMPFELLGNRVPVVRALFSMQDARTRPTSLPGLTLQQVHIPEHTATNDLMLWTMETQDGLIAVLNYSADLFARDSASAMLEQFRALLRSALAAPATAVARLSMVGERADATAGEALLLGAPTSVVEHIRRHVIDTPRAAAIRQRAQVTDYGALWSRAQGVSRALRALGLKGGASVAVCTEPGADRHVAVLGVLAAGGCVVLVDPQAAPAYAAELVRQSGVRALVTDAASEGAIDADVPSVSLEAIVPGVTDANGSELASEPSDIGLEEPAFRLPAMRDHGTEWLTVSHRALSATIAAANSLLQLSAGQTVATVVASASDTAPQDLLAPLVAGACVSVPSEDAEEDGEVLASFVASAVPDVLVAPAMSWQALRAVDWPGAHALCAVVLGHADDELRAWLASVSERLFQVHGAPNLGGWAAAHDVITTRGALLLGRPMTPDAAWVRIDSGERAAAGVPGTLVWGGADGIESGQRARVRSDGMIQLLPGDANALLRPTGTVWLPAIERRLRAHPTIADACVTSFTDASGRARLVAFVVRRSGSDSATDSQLRRALRDVLPPAFVPQLFVDIDVIPRLPTGAAARRRLASPFASVHDAATRVAPRSEQERYLASLWREYLPVTEIGVHDNFFSLGGYSLLCFQLVRRVAQETGSHLSPRGLLFGTLEQVAQQLAAQQGTPASQGVSRPASAPAVPPDGLLGRLKGMISPS